MRSGHKFLTPMWRVSIICFLRHILFSFLRIVCSSRKFLAHTHDISFHSPNLSRTLAVHRIRWCFEPVGAGRAKAVPCCSLVGRYQRHKLQWERHGWASAKTAVQNYIQFKDAWEAFDGGQFLVTGPRDVATKPSHFYCRVCRKDLSVLTHYPHEILRHFQGSKHFPRDQRPRLETPG